MLRQRTGVEYLLPTEHVLIPAQRHMTVNSVFILVDGKGRVISGFLGGHMRPIITTVLQTPSVILVSGNINYIIKQLASFLVLIGVSYPTRNWPQFSNNKVLGLSKRVL